MSDYKWAVNKIKLQRAIEKSKHKTEEEIFELYQKFGGLIAKGVIISTPAPRKETEVFDTPVMEETEPAQESVIAKVKRVYKKKAK